MSHTNPRVLVLGATGMLGRVVYSMLNKRFLGSVRGTARVGDNFLYLNANTIEKDLTQIFETVDNFDYVVNCIGLLRSYHAPGHEPTKTDFVTINTCLPLILDRYAEKLNFKLIHVSTNSVFSPLAGKVDELSIPSPEGVYGLSKCLGEPDGQNTLTIRSSFIGFDPIEKKGLVEMVQTSGSITGYLNQPFAGCTTVQFAEFLIDLMAEKRFTELRALSKVLHFAPLSVKSKYGLLSAIRALLHSGVTIHKGKSTENTTQQFVSCFSKQINSSKYKLSLKATLEHLENYEHLIYE